MSDRSLRSSRIIGCVLVLATLACPTACGATHATGSSPARTPGPRLAHGSIGPLHVAGGYVPRPASRDVAAAYLVISNDGPTADALIGARSSATGRVEVMRERRANGAETMRTLRSLPVPAHGHAALTPGHAHLMLEHPKRVLRVGDTVRVTLTFAHAGQLRLTLPVVPMNGPGGASSSGMSGMPGM